MSGRGGGASVKAVVCGLGRRCGSCRYRQFCEPGGSSRQCGKDGRISRQPQCNGYFSCSGMVCPDGMRRGRRGERIRPVPYSVLRGTASVDCPCVDSVDGQFHGHGSRNTSGPDRKKKGLFRAGDIPVRLQTSVRSKPWGRNRCAALSCGRPDECGLDLSAAACLWAGSCIMLE